MTGKRARSSNASSFIGPYYTRDQTQDKPALTGNPAAAQHQVVPVEHRRLAGRDGALRGVQLHFDGAAGRSSPAIEIRSCKMSQSQDRPRHGAPGVLIIIPPARWVIDRKSVA